MISQVDPCARIECWTDPFATEPAKALESIGNTLKASRNPLLTPYFTLLPAYSNVTLIFSPRSWQAQYERWQGRAQFKLCLDPTVDDIKKNALLMRRQARRDRVLFHYNGHGVPRPTRNGELWVFNKTFTQSIPPSILELQQWIGAPGVYVFDCASAGNIMDYCIEHAQNNAAAANDAGSSNNGANGGSGAVGANQGRDLQKEETMEATKKHCCCHTTLTIFTIFTIFRHFRHFTW